MNTKTLILPVTALVIGASVLYASTRVSAFDVTNSNHGYMIHSLAQKLGLSDDQVQEAFDEIRADHHAQMFQEFENRLDQAVASGKITQTQKQQILDMHEQIQAQHQQQLDESGDFSPEQWRQQANVHHQQLEQWADENNIDISFLGKSFDHHLHMMGHDMHHMWDR